MTPFFGVMVFYGTGDLRYVKWFTLQKFLCARGTAANHQDRRTGVLC